MIKLLFLDIDGVLNTNELINTYDHNFICPDRIIILKRIIDSTCAHIVLSSDWRRTSENRNKVRKALKLQDLDFIDCTPMLSRKLSQYCERHLEISTWLEVNTDHGFTKFAIIDDMSHACIPNMKNNFFKTSADHGLTDEIADNIIKFLNS